MEGELGRTVFLENDKASFTPFWIVHDTLKNPLGKDPIARSSPRPHPRFPPGNVHL